MPNQIVALRTSVCSKLEFPIRIPPLRERLDDLPFLVEHFLKTASEELNKKKPTTPPELLTLLGAYHFPGNIRELRSMIFDAVSRHKSMMLSLEAFRNYIFKDPSQIKQSANLMLEHETPFVSFSDRLPTLKQISELLVAEAMKRSQSNISIASKLLGISRQALSARLKKTDD